MKKNKMISPTLMAFGKVRETKEFQREFVWGVGAVNIIAVNPTREEQNTILGNNANSEPINYVDTATVKNAKGDDVEVPRARVSFIVKTDPKIACNNGIETTQFVSFFITKEHQYSHKSGVTKVQVIDRFGRTAWVTAEELRAHAIPVYDIKRGERAGQKMKANLDPQYRPAYIGEPELIETIRQFLNFPRPDVYNRETKTWTMKTNEEELADCMCLFERIDDFFKGDFSEVRDAVMGAPKNAYKTMFGVRVKADGTMQQAVYTRLPINLAVTTYTAFEAALVEDATAEPPRHPDTFYKAGPLEKYQVTPTDYSQVTPPEAPAESAQVEDLPQDTSPFGDSF